jgi:hypothetical protein
MSKRFILIGILVILVALAVSAFTWITINKSNGMSVGKSSASVTLDKGERDSFSPSSQPAKSLVGQPKGSVIIDKGERDSFSPSLQLAKSLVGQPKGSVTIDKGERDLIP